jgi:peptidoglycan/LPS O-acetylase OafA/YrhL
MNSSPAQDPHRPDIDGLRAIAVLPVILYHAGFSCPGGFVGVDVFFVISGYLITRIVERDLQQRRFSLMNFYQRRIRRIFPALFAMLAVSTGVAVVLLLPSELVSFGKSLIAAAAFSSNVFFYRHSGYFDASALLQPLLHTWTLSVEEQFYIFWPLLLALLGWRFLARWKLPLLALILFGSLLLSAYWVAHSPNAAFYLLPSRAWELALGAILSLAPVTRFTSRLPPRAAGFCSLLGLAMLMASVAAYSGLVPFPGFAALLPCVGAALVIAVGREGLLSTRILSFPPLVLAGLISYSLYLWHWPILVLAHIVANRELVASERAGLVALTCVVAWLSWRFVERPFRNPRFGGSSRLWVSAGLATSALFLVIGTLLLRSGGFPGRSPQVARWVAAQQREAELFDRSPCVVTTNSLPAAGQCLLGAAASAPSTSVVLWGDSHAAQFAQVLDGIGRNLGITIRQLTKAGCPPTLGVAFLNSDRAG